MKYFYQIFKDFKNTNNKTTNWQNIKKINKKETHCKQTIRTFDKSMKIEQKMIDYLLNKPENLQLYSVQQTFQKTYEHQDKDTFNTFYNITNYSHCQNQTLPPQKIDHLFVIDPEFFDKRVIQQKNLQQHIQNIEQNFIKDTQNRLGIVSLCSSDSEILECFNKMPHNQILYYQQISEDTDFGVLNSFQGVINRIKKIIQLSSEIQRKDAILSITIISPNNFSSKSMQEEEMKIKIQDNLSKKNILKENDNNILVNCISVDQSSNYFLSCIAEQYPQSMFYNTSTTKKINSFISSLAELMKALSKIYVTNIETTLKFQNTSSLVDIEVLNFPSYWEKVDQNSYKFKYPFFYDQQDISHLFKFKVTLKGFLTQEKVNEIIGLNSSKFSYNNQDYFFERNLEFPLAQEIQDSAEEKQDLNIKCEQTFLKEKFVIPTLKQVLQDLRIKQNQVTTQEKINKTLEQIAKANSNTNYIIKYGKFVLENILILSNQEMQKNQPQRSVSPNQLAEEALFVLKNQLFTSEFYQSRKLIYS